MDTLINNKEHDRINSITHRLDPLRSKEIQYPQPKDSLSLIVEFILTLKEKQLLPCIVFTDNRTLCEQMAGAVADHFRRTEDQLRATKYKDQIDLLNQRVEQGERMRAKTKTKPKKDSQASRKRNKDEENGDDRAEVEMMEEDQKNQWSLSGYEQQLLNGMLDEGTLANRRGCDQELVDALIERAARENPRLVGYMERGVAYHHSGLNNKGRVAVEALFRNRYVQVVFSTATLGQFSLSLSLSLFVVSSICRLI